MRAFCFAVCLCVTRIGVVGDSAARGSSVQNRQIGSSAVMADTRGAPKIAGRSAESSKAGAKGAAGAGKRSTAALSGPANGSRGVPMAPMVLLQELLSLQTLYELKLSPAQIQAVGGWLEQAVRMEKDPDEEERAARVVILLRQERDLVAAQKPLPTDLMQRLTRGQGDQGYWQAQQDRLIQNATEALLFRLTPEQRGVLANQQLRPYQLETSRSWIQEAIQATVKDYDDLKAQIEKRYPSAAPRIESVFELARSMKPLDLARQLNTLALKVAEIIAFSAPASAANESDSTAAQPLAALLRREFVQRTLIRQCSASAAASVADLSFDSDVQALLREQDALQQQVQALIVLLSVGFTKVQLFAAAPWLDKAEALRKPGTDASHDIQAALEASTRRVSDAIVQGREPSLDTDANSPDFLNAIQFQQQSIRADLQLGAMAMLNAMPSNQMIAFASGEPPTQKATRILTQLTSIRTCLLTAYLANEPSWVRQLLPAAQEAGAETGIRDQLRAVRLMSEAVFLASAPGIIRSLGRFDAVAATIPTPVADAKTPKTEAELDKEEDMQNTASQHLAIILDVPGLAGLVPALTGR